MNAGPTRSSPSRPQSSISPIRHRPVSTLDPLLWGRVFTRLVTAKALEQILVFLNDFLQTSFELGALATSLITGPKGLGGHVQWKQRS
jgi:hypothetical protein